MLLEFPEKNLKEVNKALEKENNELKVIQTFNFLGKEFFIFGFPLSCGL